MFYRTIGLPSEGDWPRESSIPYLSTWGPKSPGLLPDLGPEGTDLLQVTVSMTFSAVGNCNAVLDTLKMVRFLGLSLL